MTQMLKVSETFKKREKKNKSTYYFQNGNNKRELLQETESKIKWSSIFKELKVKKKQQKTPTINCSSKNQRMLQAEH